MLAIPFIVGGIVLAILLVAGLYARYYIKVPPDRAAIFTGRRGYRVVTGGASIKMPLVERVDHISLAPFEIPLKVQGAYSSEGVPVNVDAVALLRIDGDNEEGIKTAAARFLSSSEEDLQRSIENIMLGHIRSVVASLSVEEINSNREKLIAQITEHAGTEIRKLGLVIEAFTIQHINDEHGYLDNLGRKRIAEIKKDAEIGEAEAQRDAKIRSAAARQEGETAEAAADATIAEAQRDRDVRRAAAKGEVDRQNAIAAQAGPLSEAEARKAVVVAEVAVETERTRSEIAVEEQEIAKAEKHLEATIIKPAEAERTAAITRAEGQKAATIAGAQASSEARRLEGVGEADARTAKAAAHQSELEAEGAGLQAQLEGEAAGKLKLAEALEKYNAAGIQLTIAPELIKTLPAILGALAAPMGQIDNIVMIDSGGGDGTNSPMAKWGTQVPLMLGNGLTVLKALGFDLSAMIGADGAKSNGSHQVNAPADSPELEAVASRVAATSGESEREDH